MSSVRRRRRGDRAERGRAPTRGARTADSAAPLERLGAALEGTSGTAERSRSSSADEEVEEIVGEKHGVERSPTTPGAGSRTLKARAPRTRPAGRRSRRARKAGGADHHGRRRRIRAENPSARRATPRGGSSRRRRRRTRRRPHPHTATVIESATARGRAAGRPARSARRGAGRREGQRSAPANGSMTARTSELACCCRSS